MTENFSTHNCQLSLVELSDIAAGGDEKIFAGEKTNSGKQVGAMTNRELLKLYKELEIDYRFYDGNVALFFDGSFFPTPFKLQTVG